MATSSSGGSVQIDFNLSTSLDDNVSSNSPTEECPLCFKSRKTFYCKICIRNGDFVRSSTHCIERYAEKHLRLLRIKKEKRDVETACEKLLQGRLKRAELVNEIEACKQRLKLLHLLIRDTRDRIARKKSVTAQLKCDNNKIKNNTLPIYKDKVSRLHSIVNTNNDVVRSRKEDLAKLHIEFKKEASTRIKELVKYIFPITVVQPTKSQEDCDTVSELNEAATMAYLRGRWVLTDTLGELQHCIVAPTLPGSGDYSAFNDWVTVAKDGVPQSNSDVVKRNPAHNISAALTYTTQLVNILAFYLDVRLPTKLCYSDMRISELNPSKFKSRVSRLNLNVLHLCLSQNVHPDLLHPSQTLQNILQLLECSDLGRLGPIDVEPLVAQGLEDQLRSSSDDSEEDGDHLPVEWERVPHMSCPDMINMGPVSGSVTSQPQTTSMAGGLASAAASIASLWRGWTGNR